MPSATASLALAATLGLGACAEWNAGVASVNSYSGEQIAAQQKNVQGADDNVAAAWSKAGCALPYGEIVRNGSGNPNLPQAVITLCGSPSGFTIIHATTTATATTTIPTTTVPAPAPPSSANGGKSP